MLFEIDDSLFTFPFQQKKYMTLFMLFVQHNQKKN